MSRRGDNIYKRKDNRWEGRYPCGYNADGKTRYCSVYGRTYTEVREKLVRIQKEKEKNVKHANMTVKELFELWLLKTSTSTKESTQNSIGVRFKSNT